MIKIALCDDNEIELRRLRLKVDTILEENFPNDAFIIQEYTASVELEAELNSKEVADVFILDVEMPELNGFQLAKKIQDRNAAAVIFFFTAHMEMANRGYLVKALRYINKLNGDRELKNALITAVKTSIAKHNRYIQISYDRVIRRIPISHIMYVTIENKKLMIYLRYGADPVRDGRGIKELIEELNDDRFIMINRGTFVNADYVELCEPKRVLLTSGKELDISRRMAQDAKNSISKYWSRHL